MKRSLILSSVFVVIIICCLRAYKIKDFVEQMTLDLFQNCDVPEEASVIFYSEIDLLLMMTPLVDSLRTVLFCSQ